jgi:hypothetical protein
LGDSSQYKNLEDWKSHLLAHGKYAFALHQLGAVFPGHSDTAVNILGAITLNGFHFVNLGIGFLNCKN